MLSIPLSAFLLIKKNFCGCYFSSCKCSKQEIWHCCPRKELKGADLNSRNNWRRNCMLFLKEAIKNPGACRRYIALGVPTWYCLGLWQSIDSISSLLLGRSFSCSLFISHFMPFGFCWTEKKNYGSALWLTCIFSASRPLRVKVEDLCSAKDKITCSLENSRFDSHSVWPHCFGGREGFGIRLAFCNELAGLLM